MLLPLFLLSIPAAVILLRSSLSVPPGREASMSVSRATLYATNYATLTGFQTTIALDSLLPAAQWTGLTLTILGCMLSWTVGGALVARTLRLPITATHTAMTGAAMLLLAAVVGLATSAPGRDTFPSVFNAISAVANGGTWLGPSPLPQQLLTIYLPLAVLGGVGASVVVELCRWPVHRHLSQHATTTLWLLALLFILGFGFMLLTDRANRTRTPAEAVARASIASLNARSAGLPHEMLSSQTRQTQWTTALLMLVGGGSGGSAGGLKVTTLAALGLGLLHLSHGQNPGRLFGVAVAWGLTYLLLVGVTFWLLLGCTAEQSPDRLLLLAISAAGNVGLSSDVLSISNQGAYVLSAAMLAGRLLPLAVLAWLARLPDDAPAIAVG